VFRVATNRFQRHGADGSDTTADAGRWPEDLHGESQAPSVWISRCLTEPELAFHSSLLSDDEILKSRTLRLPGDRERYLTSRTLLRLALSLTLASRLHPSAWRFSLGRFGKPEVSPGLPAVSFNLSHAGNLVVIAVDPTSPIGVDVEKLDGLGAADIPASVLSPKERSMLDRCDEAARAREFVRLWTLKEAHAKRAGLGIHLDFSSFDLDWQPGRETQTIETNDGALESRTIRTSDAPYQVSVALSPARNPRPVSWREVGIGDLARPWLTDREMASRQQVA
jgi:4'-phosphopantetheinyl transferase